ncbi:MAG: peptidylprolyl isomerase [Candidatus Margulisbacteria bacterium]|nr:peptidylprolyl isomerase [Candidatus Margulisiibacteriota bacterium]
MEEIKNHAQTILNKVLSGEDLRTLGQEESKANPGKVLLIESEDFQYKDQFPETDRIGEELFKLGLGKVGGQLVDNSDYHYVDTSGQLTRGAPSYSIIQVTEKRDIIHEINTPKKVNVRHILIAFKGAQKTDRSITRTEDEAKKRADEVVNKIKEGSKFEDLAKEYSDDTSSKEKGGELTSPVQNDGTYVKEFENEANTTAVGQSSRAFKSPFGFHILKVDSIIDANTEKRMEPQVKYIELYFDASADPWKKTGLDSKYLLSAEVEYDQALQPYIAIQFNDEGAILFEEITARNIGKPLGIFVDGLLISAPNVNEKITGGRAQLTGHFTYEEANNLVNDLNKAS